MLSMQKIFCDLSGWKMHFRFHMWNFFHQKLSSPNANIVFKQDLKACDAFNVKRNCFPNVEFDVVWFSDSCGVVLEWRERWVVSKWNSWCCPSDSWPGGEVLCHQPSNHTATGNNNGVETLVAWVFSKRAFFNTPLSSRPKDFDPPTKFFQPPNQKCLTLLTNKTTYWQE